MDTNLTAFDIAFIVISLMAIVRLLTYQRDGATFKRSKSLIAWALLCGFAWITLLVITGQKCAAEFPLPTFPSLVLITGLIFYTHGNISALFRILSRIQ